MANGEYHIWLKERLGKTCVENLKKHGFDARFMSDGDEAFSEIMKMAGQYESFGFGGSSTTRDMGIVKALKDMGKTIYDHWELPENITDYKMRQLQGRADCFFTSANAISATGEIVNVDGVGNRNNGMTFGCPKVIVVAGINKVTRDIHSALRRIKEIAGPMRAKSLNMDTPCVKTGVCMDCNAPQRICRVTTILHRKPMMTDISVFIINRNLGF